MNYLAIFLGGGIGSLLRYLTTISFKKITWFNLPWGTFFSNLLASFLLGLFVGFFLTKTSENEWLRYFLIIGLCGGFSTFSTFSLENYKFIETNQYASFLGYSLLSIVVSLVLIFLGIQLSSKF